MTRSVFRRPIAKAISGLFSLLCSAPAKKRKFDYSYDFAKALCTTHKERQRAFEKKKMFGINSLKCVIADKNSLKL